MNVAKTGPRISALERQRRITGLFFILPSAILIGIFMLVPVIQIFIYSFSDWNGIATDFKFVGLQNYKDLFTIHNAGNMIWATLFFVVCDVLLKNVLAFVLAMALNKKGRGRVNRSMMRTAWYLPALLSGIVTGISWHIMYNYNNGVVNYIIKALGGQPVNWLETYGLCNVAIVIACVWAGIGACCIIYLAGLQGISQDLYEAAYIDGASQGQLTRYITIPMMAPAITINIITSTIGAFKAYELPATITTGPANSAQLITSKIYAYCIQQTEFGKGSALAVVLILIIILISLIQLVYLRRNEEKNG